MAKKKISNTHLILGAIVIAGVAYLVLRKPKAITSGSDEESEDGDEESEGSGTVDMWTYVIVQLSPGLWRATIIDSNGNSETMTTQPSSLAAEGLARLAIQEYGGIPVRVQ